MNTNNINEYFELETDEEYLETIQRRYGFDLCGKVIMAEIKQEEKTNIIKNYK